MDDIEVEKVLNELLEELGLREGKQMSDDVSISVKAIRVSAKKLTQYSTKIESVINYVNANLSRMDRDLFHFESEITSNHSIVITMQFTFDDDHKHVTFHEPNKKEILKKAIEIADKINDHNQVAVIFKEIRKIFRKRGLDLVLDHDKPRCAEIRFARYDKGDLKYTIADDHLHLHRTDVVYKDDELGVSAPLADPEVLEPTRLESNLRSMLCRIADYKIAWMTAVRERVESLSFFNANWKHSADSVFKEP